MLFRDLLILSFGILKFRPYLRGTLLNLLKSVFELFPLTNVSNYCEERKIKLLIKVFILKYSKFRKRLFGFLAIVATL